MMKKMLLLFLSLAMMLNGAVAATKKAKTTKAAPLLLDWQGHDAGTAIPCWITFVAENDKRKVVEEFGLEDYVVWIFHVHGTNVEFLELWTDKVELQSNVAQSISMEIGRAASAALHAEHTADEQKVEKTIEDVTTILSAARVSGLERFASFWTKIGTAKPVVKKIKSENDCDSSYEYYAVWGVPKHSFKKQLDAAMKRLPESVAQDSRLMELIEASIETVISGDADASLEGTTYDDIH